MSRRHPRFKQTDLTRAIRAARRAGENMAVEILPDGTIRLVPAGDKPSHDIGLSPGLVL